MSLWRRRLCSLAHTAGVTRLLDRNIGVRILTYHSVTSSPTNDVPEAQSAALFREQLEFIQRRFRVVSLKNAVESMGDLSATKNARPALVITFDDGFLDNYECAFPCLRHFGIPATVFVVTDFLDRGRVPWPTRLREIMQHARRHAHPAHPGIDLSSDLTRRSTASRLKGLLARLTPDARFATIDRLVNDLEAPPSQIRPLTWAQVRMMASAGIAFGSHTVFHSILPEMPDDIVEMELDISRKRLEAELGVEYPTVAYPNGGFDSRILRIAQGCGYCAGVTQRTGSNSQNSNLLALHRVQIPPNCNEGVVGALLVRAAWRGPLEHATRRLPRIAHNE
jgi:peptidoglycan/xylan/chitin deacetylase (PgdA/CDA1 family)